MTIKIPIASPPNDEDLRALTSATGHELPQNYLAFVQAHDGAVPQPNSIAFGDNESRVRRFIPVRETAGLMTEIDGFPCGVVPLAEDDCGNYFYLEPKSGGVHFWDHEIDGPDELVSPDLNSFLGKLAPFEASDVKLAPGQVRSAWIDPDFKKRFEN